MNLVQVDVVRLQTLEAAVQGLLYGFPADESGPAANPVESPALCRNFCSDDELFARLLFEPAAEIGFGAALGLRPRGYGIHLRRIDEIDAAGDGIVELLVSIALAVLLSPRHGTEADIRHAEVARSKFIVFHSRLFRVDCALAIARCCGFPQHSILVVV